MVTLSVTRSRVAGVLSAAADAFKSEPWDPYLNPLMTALDAAADCVPGKTSSDSEATTVAAWDALEAHLGQWPGDWERTAGRTQLEVEAALRGAAGKAAVS